MSRGNTLRHVRLDNETWEAFGRVAAARGTNRAALLRAFVMQEIERSRLATGDLLEGKDRSK